MPRPLVTPCDMLAGLCQDSLARTRFGQSVIEAANHSGKPLDGERSRDRRRGNAGVGAFLILSEMGRALAILAEGRMPDIAKPLKGFDPGVMELALRHRREAYRVVSALRIGADIRVIHAFQKKSKPGVETPRQEIDLIRERLKRLKERLQ